MNLYQVTAEKPCELGFYTATFYVAAPSMTAVCNNYQEAEKIELIEKNIKIIQ